MQKEVKPYKVDYERDGVVSNVIVLASSAEEALKKAKEELKERIEQVPKGGGDSDDSNNVRKCRG